MMNGSYDQQRQDSLKRRWQDHSRRQQINNIMDGAPSNNPPSNFAYYGNNKNNNNIMGKKYSSSSSISNSGSKLFQGLLEDDDIVLSKVVPAVTVVLEGRSICQRISLHNHGSYQSLAKELRQMFVEEGSTSDHHDSHKESSTSDNGGDLDLSNAIPGHLIAYEDMENDLLLAGDLSWEDFVRVAKRIRILPVKGNSSRKGASTRGE